VLGFVLAILRMATSPVRELLDRALSGDRASLGALFEKLAPVIQARVVRILSRGRRSAGRDARQELMDLTQQTFVALLENDGRALRAWRPDGGLSVENFVGLFAERQTLSILRTGRRSPWTEDATEAEDLAAHVGADEAHDEAVLSRDHLQAVVDRLREELSPMMLHVFYALWVDETPVPTICAETGMSADSVYAARSRIAKRARAIAAQLEERMSDPRPVPANTQERHG
jgi:RNA polymerase sigma-70 factor (ECF subfamily)